MAYRLGIDSGGTFTDVVLFDDKRKTLHITKTPSTPANPAIGVIMLALYVAYHGVQFALG